MTRLGGKQVRLGLRRVLRYSSEDHANAATRGPCSGNYSPSLSLVLLGGR
jgi:hypothetical protein